LVPTLVEALRDEDDEVRRAAADALRHLGSDAVPGLVAALKSKAPRLRIEAVRILGAIGPKAESALPVLVRTLRDKREDTEVRRATARAVGQIIASGSERLALAKQELQGVWHAVSAKMDGRDVSDEMPRLTFVFRKEKFSASGAYLGQSAAANGVYRVDLSRSPKQITLTVQDREVKGTVLRGVYKVDNDVLTLCLPSTEAGEVPTSFPKEVGEGLALIVLKREPR
jgi:uncharacterized protein (TIGR03067 family)